MDATTIEEITKKGFVEKTALYQHFSDKGERVFGLLGEQVETSVKPLKRVLVKGLCIFFGRTAILCSLNKGAWRDDHGTTKELLAFEL